eukprot:116314_1
MNSIMLHKARKIRSTKCNNSVNIIQLCKGRKIKQHIVKPKLRMLCDITNSSKRKTERNKRKGKRKRLFSSNRKRYYIKKCEGRRVFGSKKERHKEQMKKWHQKYLTSYWWKQYRKNMKA